MFNCVLKVKVITYNDIHLLINPMYLNIAVLFISGATRSYTGKLVSVITSKLSWLDMSVCKLDCNEDIFVTFCSNVIAFIITHYFEQHPYNTQWYICSTPEGVLEVHEMFYYSRRV